MKAIKVTSTLEFELFKTTVKNAGLPVSDLDYNRQALYSFFDGATLVATAGLETFENGIGLLRSVSVNPELRGEGFGRKLVAEMLKTAQNQGIGKIFLLTETASGFFLRMGFVVVTRGDLPEEIKQSTEFKSVCPASAAVLARAL